MTHPVGRGGPRRGPRRDGDHLLKTVYQTLHELAELGEIVSLDVGTGMTRFDPNVDEAHHHLVCRHCGKVRDLVTPTSPTARFPTGADVGLRGGSGRDRLPRSVPGLPRAGAGRRRAQGRQRAVANRHWPTQPTVTTTQQQHERNTVPELKGSKTEANLKEAFAGESQANRRYLYFAQKADVEGYPDVAALFRSVAEGETGHAFGHFDFLREVGDPVTGVPVGPDRGQPQVGHRR